MPVQGHEVRKEEEGRGIKYGSGRGGETRPTRNKRHTRAGRRQVVLLWFARYFAASAFGFAIIWLLGLTIKRFFYMEQNVFGQREASGQWGCFVLSLNGASALLAAAFAFAPAWPPTETRMGGEGGIRAQQQPRLDIRGVGCFANRCGCLILFLCAGFGFGGFRKAAKCTNGNPTAPPGRVSSPEPWQVVDGLIR